MALGLVTGLNPDGHHLIHTIGLHTVTWRCQCGEPLGIDPIVDKPRRRPGTRPIAARRPLPSPAVADANIKHRGSL